jgi:thiamine biosynthesis lipoprotein
MPAAISRYSAPTRTPSIRDPRDPAALLAAIVLRDEALATSAGRCNPFRGRSVGECAIIDPGSGAPVRAIRGASVRAASCMMADALTKVVMIAGEDAGAVLDQYGAHALFVTDAGETYASADWQARCAD